MTYKHFFLQKTQLEDALFPIQHHGNILDTLLCFALNVWSAVGTFIPCLHTDWPKI